MKKKKEWEKILERKEQRKRSDTERDQVELHHQDDDSPNEARAHKKRKITKKTWKPYTHTNGGRRRYRG